MVVRVRHHVNPLANKYQSPIAPPPWETIYANRQQPLHLDIGCARGQFLFQMAPQEPNWNFLGLEIREPLVTQANLVRDEQALSNLHFIFCNVNNSLTPLLESLGKGVLHRVSIQFPDPWFKKRHQKRRVVQPEVVDLLATYLIEGGMVFLQSDVEAVEVDMCDRFSAHPAFQRESDTWLDTNPFPVPTEREVSTLSRGEPVYRAIFRKQ